MPLRVVQIYKDYYPPVKGGIEGHIHLLARGLREQGHDVQVLVSNTRNRMETETPHGIPVLKAPQFGRVASAPINPTLHAWMRKVCRDADVLHFHLPNPTAVLAYLAAPGLPGKVVATYHSDIVRQKLLGKGFAPFLHLFLRRCDAVIATSPPYIETSPVLPRYREKCTVVPLGVDLERFRAPRGWGERQGALRKRFGDAIVLFVGRFRYYKGLEVLIDAMHGVEARLLLVGDGPLDRALRERVARQGLGEKVHFLGELPDEAVNEFLHLCDVFVLPSVLRSEAFGIAQLEAMACAKPVVCCELGTGTSFVNEHGRTGLVVPPGDADALARNLRTLLENPEMRAAQGAAGRRRVEALFSRDRMVQDTLGLYRRLTGPGGGRPRSRRSAHAGPARFSTGTLPDGDDG